MKEINKYIKEQVALIEDKIIAVREHLHKNPEISFELYKTMGFICSYLDELGIEYKSEIAKTGVVALIKGEKGTVSPKTLLLRADMDALPICENSDKPYKSINEGSMHACGHDAHMAVMLGVCEVLSKNTDKFSGYVKVVFQPAEETSGGAKPMIDEGVLENPKVDACLALHSDTDIETGKIRIKPGSLYASPDDFKITVKGRGGHGAEPHNCVDTIRIAAQVITALMSIVSRDVDPFENAVITIGSIHAGSAANIIPDTAEIMGTVRSLKPEVRALLKNRIGEVANSVCTAFGAECVYEFIKSYPPLINDEKLAENLYTVASDILGEDNCIYGGNATMAGEDFAYFAESCPSVLFKLGCMNEEKGCIYPLHHSSFDIDEDALSHGISVFTAFALDYLN